MWGCEKLKESRVSETVALGSSGDLVSLILWWLSSSCFPEKSNGQNEATGGPLPCVNGVNAPV